MTGAPAGLGHPFSPRLGSPRGFSSRRPVALGMLSLAVLLGGALGWGAFASISGAVIAPGRVEVENRAQAVEHVDGGTVQAVLVRDGDHVAAGDIGARIAAAGSRIAELELQVLRLDANRIAEAEGEAREAQARETQVRERLVSVRARLAHMEVRAPVSGEVFEMQVFAPAEVVRPGEPIPKILPEDAALVVRATLDPIHVDQVWPGQEATVLFTAFAARTTPAFEGRVLRAAADASLDERTGLAWYEAELAMGRAIAPEAEWSVAAWAGRQWDGVADGYADGPGRWIARQEWAPDWLSEVLSGRHGAERSRVPAPPGPGADNAASALALTPGMPVEVYLLTGERSPLGYLVKPLSDYFSRALREE